MMKQSTVDNSLKPCPRKCDKRNNVTISDAQNEHAFM